MTTPPASQAGKLTWTSQAPTEPGWYWCKQPNRKRGHIVHVLKINRLSCDCAGDEWRTLNAYHWSGPLPEPQEPTTDAGRANS